MTLEVNMPDTQSSENDRDCDNCKYFLKYYGGKDESGNLTVQSYWCSKKNCKIREFPGKCALKKVKKVISR